MLDFFSKGVKKIFGTKYERDVAKYGPVVDEINDIYEGLHGLSNDDLRQKTHAFRQRIADYLSEIDQEIESILAEAREEEDIYHKEELFKEVDQLRDDRNKALEEVLLELLPEAFAVVKETARRFLRRCGQPVWRL